MGSCMWSLSSPTVTIAEPSLGMGGGRCATRHSDTAWRGGFGAAVRREGTPRGCWERFASMRELDGRSATSVRQRWWTVLSRQRLEDLCLYLFVGLTM